MDVEREIKRTDEICDIQGIYEKEKEKFNMLRSEISTSREKALKDKVNESKKHDNIRQSLMKNS